MDIGLQFMRKRSHIIVNFVIIALLKNQTWMGTLLESMREWKLLNVMFAMEVSQQKGIWNCTSWQFMRESGHSNAIHVRQLLHKRWNIYTLLGFMKGRNSDVTFAKRIWQQNLAWVSTKKKFMMETNLSNVKYLMPHLAGSQICMNTSS